MKHLLIFFAFLLIPAQGKGSENFFIPCRHGLEMLAWDLEAIGHAEQSIELFLCIAGGNVFDKVLKACEERIISQGVQVYAIASPLCFSKKDYKILERLKKDYPHNFHYEFSFSVSSLTSKGYGLNDLHIKGVIIDETYFSFGGTNFHDYGCTEGTYTPLHDHDVSKEALPIGMRDYDVIGKGPIAKELRIMFYKQFALWNHYRQHAGEFINDPEYFQHNDFYFSLDESPIAFVPSIDFSERGVFADAYIVFGGPVRPNLITREYAQLIEKAQFQIDIANLFCCPASEIFSSVKKALNRGVSLNLLTNGLHEHSPSVANYYFMANRIHYVPFFTGKEYGLFEKKIAERDLIKNTHIFEYQVPKVSLHKKIMIIDKRYLVVGSYNLGARSDLYDFEGILIIDSEKMSAHALDVLEEDKKYSLPISQALAMTWYFDPFLRYLAALQKQYHGIL